MARTPPCYLTDVGVAVPPFPLDQSTTADLFRRAYDDERIVTLLRRLTRKTGIARRHLASLGLQPPHAVGSGLYHSVAEQPNGPGMGARNACYEPVAIPLVREAMAALPSGAVASVDALITVSCTHAASPGLERGILLHSPIRRTVDRWHLGFMGCSAGLAAIRLAQQTAASGHASLIVTCELSSLHFQYSKNLDQLTANVLFADGVAAALISPESAPPSTQGTAVRVCASRCVALPAAADQMIWFADDHGLRLELSQELPTTLSAALPSAIAGFLDAADVRLDEIRHWIVHPGGPQILDAVEASLSLPAGALDLSRETLRDYGNMSSSTVLFILRRMLQESPRGWCVALAFGPGLTIELTLLNFE